MEQVAGIEPASQPWQGRIITAILYLHGISITSADSVRSTRSLSVSCESIMESGAGKRTRTINLLITNQLHCQLCYAGISRLTFQLLQFKRLLLIKICCLSLCIYIISKIFIKIKFLNNNPVSNHRASYSIYANLVGRHILPTYSVYYRASYHQNCLYLIRDIDSYWSLLIKNATSNAIGTLSQNFI